MSGSSSVSSGSSGSSGGSDEASVQVVSYFKLRYHVDAVYREEIKRKSMEYTKQRRAADPDFDAKLRRKWREKSKQYSERCKQDPEEAAKRRAYNKEYRRRRKAQAEAEAQATAAMQALTVDVAEAGVQASMLAETLQSATVCE